MDRLRIVSLSGPGWRLAALMGAAAVLVAWVTLISVPALAQSPPGAVGSVSVTREDGTVTADWNAVSGATKYHVTYTTDGGKSWSLAALEHATSSITISGADNDKTYIVGVRAGNDNGWSTWRNSAPTAPFTPPGSPPVTPASVSVTRSAGTLTASWPAASGATKYHVTYSSDNRKNWSLAALNHAQPSILISGVDDAKTYIVGVRAGNDSGWSGWRNSAPASPGAPPSPVSWVSVERVCDHSFKIRWDKSEGATGYDVNYSKNGRKSWKRLLSNAPNNGYGVHNYNKNKTYYIAVRAVSANGASGWTDAGPAPPPPCATSDLRAYYVAGANDANSIRVFWAGGKRASGYDVNLRENNGAEWQRIASDAPGNSYTIDTGADYGPDLIVAVRSRNGSMESEWRNAKATRLSAGGVSASAATFTLDGHTGGWWLKRTSPTAGECVAGEADFSHRVGGLDAGTGYTFGAYGDSACQRDIGSATFTTSASNFTTGSVSNLSAASDGIGMPLSAQYHGAVGFTTGADSGGYTLKSVTARFDTPTGAPGDITVAIHEADTSNSSNPDTSTALYTLSGDNPVAAGDYTFTCAVTNSVTCGLSASTTYFLVMKGSAATLSIGFFDWETTLSDNQAGGAGWAIGDVLRWSDDGGGVWSDDSNGETGIFKVTAVETPTLTVSNVTKSGATLTIANYGGDWHYKADTGPDAACKGPVTGATRTLSGLTSGTTYTYTAYSDSGCSTPLATAAAFTPGLVSVSNLSAASDGIGMPLSAQFHGAVGFTTGADSGGYTLKSITARFDTPTGAPGDITVAIHEPDTSNSSNPDTSTALYTLSGDNPVAAGDYTFNCAVTNSVTCGLSASTTYFLVMKGSSAQLSLGFFDWETTLSDNQAGGAGWAIGDVLRWSEDGGGVWSDDSNGETGIFKVTAVEK